MESYRRPFRERLRRGVISAVDSFRKLFTMVTTRPRDLRSQTMCPSCGLITPRAKASCMECGKPLRELRVARQDAR